MAMGVRACVIGVTLIACGLIAGVGATEVVLRAYQSFESKWKRPLRFIVPDARLGWRANADYRVEYLRLGANGRRESVLYSSARDGFRVFGDLNSKQARLLIIGDSFTQAVNVATESTYAALLGKALSLEVFSYGAGGFGTLQELLVLEDVLDQINP